MKMLFVSTTAAAALVAGAAAAQGAPTPSPPASGEITSTGGIMTAPPPAGNLAADAASTAAMDAAATVGSLRVGTTVRGPDGEVVGVVEEVDPGSAAMAAMVQLGLNGESAEIPASSITVTAEGAVSSLDRGEIWVTADN
ncbi:hypothetical protein [Phenylobacterium sp.]|uniref:hypothetical protein n=1 Tax=Phenylobacterium sp. TaxID=1871053 RepID=UPI0019A4E7C2|nr:hypothetical protein [Phenylobacterium sp.]MBC7168018.1 hypothetical protein [Phenylobacterium sp.]